MSLMSAQGGEIVDLTDENRRENHGRAALDPRGCKTMKYEVDPVSVDQKAKRRT
jgi:hypothetical protein